MNQVEKYLPLAGRILMSIIFIFAGIGKMADPAGTAGYMAMVGLPGILVWPAAIFEVALGLALIAGFRLRAFALLGAGFTVLTGLLFHTNFADQMQMVMFLKNLAMAGGLLFMAGFGAGQLAVDKG